MSAAGLSPSPGAARSVTGCDEGDAGWQPTASQSGPGLWNLPLKSLPPQRRSWSREGQCARSEIRVRLPQGRGCLRSQSQHSLQQPCGGPRECAPASGWAVIRTKRPGPGILPSPRPAPGAGRWGRAGGGWPRLLCLCKSACWCIYGLVCVCFFVDYQAELSTAPLWPGLSLFICSMSWRAPLCPPAAAVPVSVAPAWASASLGLQHSSAGPA